MNDTALYFLLLVAALAFFLSLGFDLVLERSEGDDSRINTKWLRRIGISLILAVLAFMVDLTTQVWLLVSEDSRALKHASPIWNLISRDSDELRKVSQLIKDLSAEHLFVKAHDAILTAPTSEPIRSLLQAELDHQKTRVEELSRLKLELSNPDEFMNKWVQLIEKAQKTIDATNLISSKEIPTQGIEAQQAAICRGVKIRRVMIYDNQDHRKNLEDLANKYRAIGIDVKMVHKGNSYVERLRAIIGSEDFVVFDDSTLLMTRFGPSFSVDAGKVEVVGEPDRKSHINELYANLYRDASPMGKAQTRASSTVCNPQSRMKTAS